MRGHRPEGLERIGSVLELHVEQICAADRAVAAEEECTVDLVEEALRSAMQFDTTVVADDDGWGTTSGR